MRFGIALPHDGLLAEPAAVAALARAAGELQYASVWSSSPVQLAGALAHAGDTPLALLAEPGTRAASDQLSDVLAARLAYVAAGRAELTVWQRRLAAIATCRLLDVSDTPPRLAGVGWAPLVRDGIADPHEWRRESGGQILVLRVVGVPAAGVIGRALAAGADELVVALPGATSLDQQLGTLADVAEQIPPTGQPGP
jgi:hypothetical protein